MHYLPTLLEVAKNGHIDLWAIDQQSREDLFKENTDKLPQDLWEKAEHRGTLHYLQKVEGEIGLDEVPPDINYVFIVTHDKSHCDEAEKWLKHLNEGVTIFIEKPLDASLCKAKKLKRKIGKKEIIYCFDHYLAKIHTFLQSQKEFPEDIGRIKRIDFTLIDDPDGIPRDRVRALNEGMIYDLFCHILAVSIGILDPTSIFSGIVLKTVKLEDAVKVYDDKCPIDGEFFAQVKFSINKSIKVTAIMGKGDSSVQKCMTIEGSEGVVSFDFRDDEHHSPQYCSEYSDGSSVRDKLESKPVEYFLGEILKGAKPHSIIGVLSVDSAFTILRLLHKARKQARKIQGKYNIGASVEEILDMQ
jgi:predicted dehydrogenase